MGWRAPAIKDDWSGIKQSRPPSEPHLQATKCSLSSNNLPPTHHCFLARSCIKAEPVHGCGARQAIQSRWVWWQARGGWTGLPLLSGCSRISFQYFPRLPMAIRVPYGTADYPAPDWPNIRDGYEMIDVIGRSHTAPSKTIFTTESRGPKTVLGCSPA
jgi:hypothetical protein